MDNQVQFFPKFIEQRIKTKFQLFQGLREEKQDEEIFHRVSEALFSETLKLLEEELDSKQMRELKEEITQIMDSSLGVREGLVGLLGVLKKSQGEVADFGIKLERRLEHLLNFLSIKSIGIRG